MRHIESQVTTTVKWTCTCRRTLMQAYDDHATQFLTCVCGQVYMVSWNGLGQAEVTQMNTQISSQEEK